MTDGDEPTALDRTRFTYSIVVPVFNSVAVVGTTIERIVETFEAAGLAYELVLVNDGSKDGSWQVIADAARRNPHVVALNLLQNYGGVGRVDDHETVHELPQRPDGGEAGGRHRQRHQAPHGDPQQRPEPLSARLQQGDHQHRRHRHDEGQLQGERRQADGEPGQHPAAVPQGPQGQQEQQHHRGLLAWSVRGQLEEALEAQQRRGRGQPGRAEPEQVAARQVGDDDRERGEQQEAQPQHEHVVGPGEPGDGHPQAREQVRQRAGAVEDPDVRRLTLDQLLAGVAVDRQVPVQLAVQAGQCVGRDRNRPDDPGPGVGEPSSGACRARRRLGLRGGAQRAVLSSAARGRRLPGGRRERRNPPAILGDGGPVAA